MVISIEFFNNHDPIDIEKKIRSLLPPVRSVMVGIDHKNLIQIRKKQISPVGTDVLVKFTCPKDNNTWEGNAIDNGKDYFIWGGTDKCSVCGSEGKMEVM